MRRALAVLALMALCCTLARAETEDVRRARTHFENGRALFSLGKYEEALVEFVASYQIVPTPRSLLNIGRTYRQLHRLDEARARYTQFLDEARPDDPDRAQVKRIIDDIDRELAELREHPPAPPPPPVIAPAPPPVVAPPPAPPPSIDLRAEPAPKPAPRASRFRRLWWLIPVSGAVAAGVGVGLYFGLRPSQVNCSQVAFCIDATHPH